MSQTGAWESTLGSPKTGDARGASCPIVARIVLHPDPARLGQTAHLFDPDDVASLRVHRNSPTFRDAKGNVAGPLQTRWVSRHGTTLIRTGRGKGLRLDSNTDEPVLLHGSQDSVVSLDEGSLAQGVLVAVGKYVVLWVGVEGEFPTSSSSSNELVGHSAAMRELRRTIENIASLNVSVLFRGETGVGKELVAQTTHRLSGRTGRCVSVNMAAIPPTTAVSALFGHRRGAFTGAVESRPGFFRDAQGGTLFLDEIGDTPIEVQPVLLRALEEGVIQPLGDLPVPVDVRVLAATDSNLEADIGAGRFRSPLLRRFDVELKIPPLRARLDDVPTLFWSFLERAAKKFEVLGAVHDPNPDRNPWVSASFGRQLLTHEWPGNVRELRNVASRLALSLRECDKPAAEARWTLDFELGEIEPSELGTTQSNDGSSARTRRSRPTRAELAEAWRASGFRLKVAASTLNVSASWLNQQLNDDPAIRRAKDLAAGEIAAAMQSAGGDVDDAAGILRVSRRALVLRMKELGSDAAQDRQS